MIKKENLVKSKSRDSLVMTMIKGLILVEISILGIKLLTNLGLKYRGYTSVGGEFLVLPLIILLKVVYNNLKDFYKEVR